MLKILIADDNQQITSILSMYAKKKGYTPILAYDGDETLKKFYDEKPDLILLDVMMPKLDGFSVCKEIRQTSTVPIIMVTARGEDFEKIMGLEIGADDYIVKPFSPKEVMARVQAIMRRIDRKAASQEKLKIGSLEINFDSYQVFLNGNKLSLTKKEFEILWTLASNKNLVFSREKLLDAVWGFDYYGDSRTVDSHIKRLRSKLDAFDHPLWTIKTIWGVGYTLETKDRV